MGRRLAGPVVHSQSTAVGFRRSDRFLAGLTNYDRVVFVTHVHPDPDGMGSMLGLSRLVETKLRKPTLLTCDGAISRAENKTMVDALGLKLTPVSEVRWQPNDAIVMVDSQPNTGRHSIPSELRLFAVIDHHETPGSLENVSVVDVRPSFGATCTLVTKYLNEQKCPIDEILATALLYGIETEVTGYPREAQAADDDALVMLYPLADQDLLAEIRNARRPHSHFECLLQALQSSFIYDRLIMSWIDPLHQPEHAAEVVDFMIRFDQVDFAFCAGVHNDKLVLSMRAAIPNAEAGELLKAVVGKLGSAGGHERRAGGCICLKGKSASAIEDLQAELRRRFLKIFGIQETRGQRLVPLREMLQNLHS